MPDNTDPAKGVKGEVIWAPVTTPLELPKVAVKEEPAEGEPSTTLLLGVTPKASPTGSPQVIQMVEGTMLPAYKQIKEELQLVEKGRWWGSE